MDDLISRQQAIDICRAPHMRNADCSDFEMAMMMLPPANNSEIPNSSDTISRQAAIDALLGITAMRNTIPLDSAIFNIKKLPSAQPETAKRIVGKSRNDMTLWYQCDMCNEPVDAQDNFCRECGRRLIDE